MTKLLALLLTLLATAASLAGAVPADTPRGLGSPLLDGILDPVLDLGALPPPKLIQTGSPSPQCKAVNGGQLQCCRATVAGDIQLVVWLAALYGYKLNPNDINGVNCEFLFYFLYGMFMCADMGNPPSCPGDNNLDACPGVKVCCQVTALVSHIWAPKVPRMVLSVLTSFSHQSPLLSLWCQDP